MCDESVLAGTGPRYKKRSRRGFNTGPLLVLLLINYALPVVCTSRYILLAKHSLLTPAWFINYFSRIKARDVLEEKVPHNFVAISRFSLDARHHSQDAAISFVKAYGHGSAKSTCHIIVAFKTKAREAKSFMPTSKLDGVERDKADAEGLACAEEAFVPVDDGGCVEFLKEETR